MVLFIIVIVRERSLRGCKNPSFTELQNKLQMVVLKEPGGNNELVLKVEGFNFYFFFFLGKHVCFE